MFSPILPINPRRTSSTVGPKPSCEYGNADSAATSDGLFSAISLATAFVKARNESFFETKSVSQLTSTSAPVVPSTKAATTPSAVTRDAALPALLPSLTRSSSSAFSMSPAASVKALLHSIIGASVLARSSATMLAVIADIVFLRWTGRPDKRRIADSFASKGSGAASQKKGLSKPLSIPLVASRRA